MPNLYFSMVTGASRKCKFPEEITVYHIQKFSTLSITTHPQIQTSLIQLCLIALNLINIIFCWICSNGKIEMRVETDI